jgi:outer membrane protein TolC
MSGLDDVPPAPAPDGASEEDVSNDVPAAAADLLPAGKPIDLGTALALVAGQNPEVNFARAQVREAYARLNRAEVMWVPDLQAGANYHRHEGNLQNIEGRIVDINRSSLNAGLGAGAVGAGTTTVPGLVIDFHAADALFGPEIARRSAWASRHAADAEINDQLLAVALAYLDLIEAAQREAIARQTVSAAEDLAETTEAFARAGQGLQADAERATTELRIRRNELLRAEEAYAVASAQLAALIRLNPAERCADERARKDDHPDHSRFYVRP